VWLTVELPAVPDGIVVEIGSLGPLPDDRDAWVAAALALPRPQDGTVRRIETGVRTHAVGWPVTIVTANVADADGVEVERRVVLLFELLVLGALVRCRIAPQGHAHWDAGFGETIIEAMLVAPIRLRGDEPVAVAEFFDL